MIAVLRSIVVVGALVAFAAACSEASPTSPRSPHARPNRSIAFGKNPGAGPGTVGGGGGGGGGAANCGQPLATLAHGAQFSKACSFQSGCVHMPLNAAARALAPKGLDLNCNIIV